MGRTLTDGERDVLQELQADADAWTEYRQRYTWEHMFCGQRFTSLEEIDAHIDAGNCTKGEFAYPNCQPECPCHREREADETEAQAIANAEWDARYHYELSVRAAIEQTLSDDEEPF